ncbi:alpha/beta hydrolase [Halieaceae bacterium IMCC14734]|uniref:Alpha/beta hydrolase n=1 Tax=Candidatus Litorirhabdus singularis TaxID=2518993 RepID=A0ABT3TL18_9GAMM|nr:alpha/beta fold hydrolase [Candidatus Litorirhabdus singularis]MCX2983005.1 alpha/beta hydrolase [Candidatus Litorirhabdus singularis]
MIIRTTMFALLVLIIATGPQLAMSNEASGSSRPSFVLVHGTFQWGGQWDALSSLLAKDGYAVHSPSMTGLGEREHLLSKQVGLSTHIEDISNYIEWLDIDNVILVSHSYGGAVITGVADKLGDRIAHVVYIDTVPLNHGENLLDAFGPEVSAIAKKSVEDNGDGWLIAADALRDPAPTMRSHPWKTYTDRIDLVGPPPDSGTIIVATESAEIFSYMRQQQAPSRAKTRGWKLYTIEGPHPLQESSPSKEEVAKILLNLAKR